LFISAISIIGAIVPTIATIKRKPADALREE
jgi:ABC-type antimicrobial peptide transport system permease subunit